MFQNFSSKMLVWTLKLKKPCQTKIYPSLSGMIDLSDAYLFNCRKLILLQSEKKLMLEYIGPENRNWNGVWNWPGAPSDEEVKKHMERQAQYSNNPWKEYNEKWLAWRKTNSSATEPKTEYA